MWQKGVLLFLLCLFQLYCSATYLKVALKRSMVSSEQYFPSLHSIRACIPLTQKPSSLKMAEISWPPKSPRDALLSSPGGRKKLQEMQNRRQNQTLGSPLKRATTTPNLRSKANQLLSDGIDGEDDEDEDEETLKLKLAAIEARLRLKQLQKNRAPARGGDDESNHSRPSSSRSHDHASSFPRSPNERIQAEEVQVPLSPTRRPAAPVAEPASPRRFLLGIDKGLKGYDVSLKRPPSSRPGVSSTASRPVHRGSRSSDSFIGQAHSFPGDDGMRRIKTFSERMAESRSMEKSRRERAEKLHMNRSSTFEFDKAEMESFKAAAAEAKTDPRPRSPVRERNTETFSREDVLRSYHLNSSSGSKRSHTSPSGRHHNLDVSQDTKPHFHHRRNHKSEPELSSSKPKTARSSFSNEAHSEKENSPEKAPDSSKFEGYSSLHLSSRILPHSFLARTLGDKKILKIPDLLKVVKAPDFELPPDVDGDYVVFGIVASKSAPKDVQQPKNCSTKEVDPYDDGLNNTNKYMAITLTDLKWTIDLFLFDTAFPRYYKLSEGVLIAILNPIIMPPPKHKLDTNRFSLAISSSDDKILEVGFARDIGFCKAVRKDGKVCQSWVDARKTEFCDFHVDVQVRRTQSKRMGVNNGTAMFGPGGRSGPRTGFFGGTSKRLGPNVLKPDGAQYDRGTQSLYYVAPAPSRSSQYHGANLAPRRAISGQSAASLIDADNDNPFVPAGTLGRGMENKEERLRRRLAEQQRERDIAQKLVSSRGGGVGAEYLRTRVGEKTASSSSSSSFPPYSSSSSLQTTAAAHEAKPYSASNSLGLNTLRKAASVKLGPLKRVHDGDRPSNVIKKTRFITANGIREAGRDSLGASDPAIKRGIRAMHNNNVDDDDDDELDII